MIFVSVMRYTVYKSEPFLLIPNNKKYMLETNQKYKAILTISEFLQI